MCVCVVISFILDDRLVDAPAGVTQEEGHTEYLHLPSAVLTLKIFRENIQPSLSLVDHDVEFCVCMYVCMAITYSRVWINRVKLSILLVVS